MFEWISSPEAWIALVTLTSLEIVLGIDNIIFISILVSRLPEKERNKRKDYWVSSSNDCKNFASSFINMDYGINRSFIQSIFIGNIWERHNINSGRIIFTCQKYS